MNKNEKEKEKLNTLSEQEMKNLFGGFAPPSEEQLEALGPWKRHIICW